MPGVTRDEATFRVKAELAEMVNGGVTMDVVDAEPARTTEHAGAALRGRALPLVDVGCSARLAMCAPMTAGGEAASGTRPW